MLPETNVTATDAIDAFLNAHAKPAVPDMPMRRGHPRRAP